MSAAEKLKALNVRYNSDIADLPDYGPDDEYGTVIINALPQIVAVVEAAEQAARLADSAALVDWERAAQVMRSEGHAALAALDETLT